MIFKTDYDSVFEGRDVLVRGYWSLSKGKRKKLTDHLQFVAKERASVPATWMLTTFVPAPLIAIHPAWMVLSGIAFLGSGMTWLVCVGDTTYTKRPKLPKIEVIQIRDDARWNALRHAFNEQEWRRFTKELSSDTELCRSLADIVFPFMDKTANLLAQRKAAADIDADHDAIAIDGHLRTAGKGARHLIMKELKRHDDQAMEIKAKADAEAEEIRQGKLRVLQGNIEIAVEDTAEYEELARQAELEQ